MVDDLQGPNVYRAKDDFDPVRRRLIKGLGAGAIILGGTLLGIKAYNDTREAFDRQDHSDSEHPGYTGEWTKIKVNREANPASIIYEMSDDIASAYSSNEKVLRERGEFDPALKKTESWLSELSSRNPDGFELMSGSYYMNVPEEYASVIKEALE